MVQISVDVVAGHAQLWLGYGRWPRIVRIWPTPAAKNNDKRMPATETGQTIATAFVVGV